MKNYILILNLVASLFFMHILYSQAPVNLTISGEVKGISDQKIYLELINDPIKPELLQEKELIGGHFKFEIAIKNNASMLNISLEDKKYWLLPDDTPGGTLFADKGQDIKVVISVNANTKSNAGYVFPDLTVDNESPSYKKYLAFKATYSKRFIEKDKLIENSSNTKSHNKEEYGKMWIDLYKEKANYLETVILNTPDSLDALFALYAFLEFTLPEYANTSSHLEWYNSLSQNIKETQLGRFFKKIKSMEEEAQSISPTVNSGNSFKDFTLKDVNGKFINLDKVLKKNQYVLLDFWASWCGPCRAEHPNIQMIYEKYKNKGFEVVAVSLDKNRDSWVKAVKKDATPWIQLSDLQGYDSNVAKDYGLIYIPMNFLIDNTGKIVATHLIGKKLKDTIEKYLK